VRLPVTGRGLKTTRTWPGPGAVASSFGRGLGAGFFQPGYERECGFDGERFACGPRQ
jgi:hypothetical protein